MPVTLYIDDIKELPELFLSVEEDFNLIDFQPFMAKELDPIADFERDLFNRQVSPDGEAWAANAPRTIKQKGHSQVLRGLRQAPEKARKGVRRGKGFARFRLSNSLTLKAKSSTGDAIREAVDDGKGAALAFGTMVEYSAIHDHGTSSFPARQHVGINETYLDEMTERFADYVLAELVKG